MDVPKIGHNVNAISYHDFYEQDFFFFLHLIMIPNAILKIFKMGVVIFKKKNFFFNFGQKHIHFKIGSIAIHY